MQVKVLQHHLDQAQPSSSTSCGVALALQEMFPGKKVRVGSIVASVAEVGEWNIPGDMKQWIQRFDRVHSQVYPFHMHPAEFELPGNPDRAVWNKATRSMDRLP